MKITNVKVELFDWTTEPWKTNDHTQFGSTVQLGVVTVETALSYTHLTLPTNRDV